MPDDLSNIHPDTHISEPGEMKARQQRRVQAVVKSRRAVHQSVPEEVHGGDVSASENASVGEEIAPEAVSEDRTSVVPVSTDRRIATSRTEYFEDLAGNPPNDVTQEPAPEDESAPESAAHEETTKPPPQQVFNVTIDGVEQEVTREELLAGYQKGKTADERLREAANRERQADAYLRQAKEEAEARRKALDPANASDRLREIAQQRALNIVGADGPDSLPDGISREEFDKTVDGELGSLLAMREEFGAGQAEPPDVDQIVEQRLVRREIEAAANRYFADPSNQFMRDPNTPFGQMLDKETEAVSTAEPHLSFDEIFEKAGINVKAKMMNAIGVNAPHVGGQQTSMVNSEASTPDPGANRLQTRMEAASRSIRTRTSARVPQDSPRPSRSRKQVIGDIRRNRGLV